MYGVGRTSRSADVRVESALPKNAPNVELHAAMQASRSLFSTNFNMSDVQTAATTHELSYYANALWPSIHFG
jgi:hypothetical protein